MLNIFAVNLHTRVDSYLIWGGVICKYILHVLDTEYLHIKVYKDNKVYKFIKFKIVIFARNKNEFEKVIRKFYKCVIYQFLYMRSL